MPTKTPRGVDRPKRPNGAGGIAWDKARGVWRVAVVGPDGKRVTRRTKTAERSDAEALAATLRVEVWDGRPRPAAGSRQAWTVGSWLTYWRAHGIGKRDGRHGKGISRNTLRREDWISDAVIAGLGDVPLRQLTPEDVEHFLGERVDGIGNDRRPWGEDACCQTKNFLARAMAEAIERGHRAAPNPAQRANVPTRAADPKARSTLTPADASRLYDAARAADRPPASALALMVTTGLRPGEAIRVQWGHVDYDGATLRVPDAKTPNGIRTVHLSEPALAVIRDRRSAAGLLARDPDAYVFPGTFAPFVSHWKLVDELRTLSKALDLRVLEYDRPPRPHELRHTVASVLIDAKVNPAEVADMLGDDVKTILDTYRHRLRAVAGEGAAGPLADVFGRKAS